MPKRIYTFTVRTIPIHQFDRVGKNCPFSFTNTDRPKIFCGKYSVHGPKWLCDLIVKVQHRIQADMCSYAICVNWIECDADEFVSSAVQTQSRMRSMQIWFFSSLVVVVVVVGRPLLRVFLPLITCGCANFICKSNSPLWCAHRCVLCAWIQAFTHTHFFARISFEKCWRPKSDRKCQEPLLFAFNKHKRKKRKKRKRETHAGLNCFFLLLLSLGLTFFSLFIRVRFSSPQQPTTRQSLINGFLLGSQAIFFVGVARSPALSIYIRNGFTRSEQNHRCRKRTRQANMCLCMCTMHMGLTTFFLSIYQHVCICMRYVARFFSVAVCFSFNYFLFKSVYITWNDEPQSQIQPFFSPVHWEWVKR